MNDWVRKKFNGIGLLPSQVSTIKIYMFMSPTKQDYFIFNFVFIKRKGNNIFFDPIYMIFFYFFESQSI